MNRRIAIIGIGLIAIANIALGIFEFGLYHPALVANSAGEYPEMYGPATALRPFCIASSILADCGGLWILAISFRNRPGR